MQSAEPFQPQDRRQELLQALGFWNHRLILERQACTPDRAAGGPPLCDWAGSSQLGDLGGVLLARPELGRMVLQRLQALSPSAPLGRPLANQHLLSEWVERAEWRLARHSSDCPRRVAGRAAELAEALRSASWIQRSFGESTRGLTELAHDWVELFQRWDWLLAGWRALQSPAPAPAEGASEGAAKGAAEGAGEGASPLADLETLVSVYLAQSDPSDLPFWLLERGPLIHPEEGPLLVVGQGPIDPALLAAAAVLSAGAVTALRLPLVGGLSQREALASSPWVRAWPELLDLQAGALPDPARWPALSRRAAPPEQAVPQQAVPQQAVPQQAVQIRLVAAAQLESAVDAALAALVEAYQEPSAILGVVAFDRVMARRLTVKLLERGIAIEDPSGWALDTTAASAPLDGLLDLVQPTAGPASLLHWLSLPVIQQALQITSSQLSSMARSLRELPSGARGLRALPPQLEARLAPLRPLQVRASRREAIPVGEWVEQIEQCLEAIGIAPLLAEDEAGLLMLGCLRQLAAEHLGPESSQVQLQWPEFRAALGRALSQMRLPLHRAGAAVRLLSLSEAALLEGLTLLVLLGATEEHMLAVTTSPLLSRRQMDAALARQPEIIERTVALGHLASVLHRSLPLICVAAPLQPGLEVRWASPWVRLRAALPGWVAAQSPAPASPGSPPSLRVEPPSLQAQLPPRIPVTSLSSLAVCPLQFCWRTQLDLSAWRPISDAEGAIERGTWLHRVAETVPPRLREPDPPQSADEWRAYLWAQLDERLPGGETDLVFWAGLRQRLASLARWLAQPSLPLPTQAESVLRGTLAQSQLALRGRADWVFPRGVIDLKTTDPATLKRELSQLRLDLQLQAYAWMLAENDAQFAASRLAFLSVQADEVVCVQALAEPLLLHRVDETLARLKAGEPARALEAMGSAEACERCPARGACRPEEWTPCSR